MIECPDCKHDWDPTTGEPCPGCGLQWDAVVEAARFLDQQAERAMIRVVGSLPGVFDLRRELGRAPTVEEFRRTRGHNS
jgi:hypothetical protein